MIREEDIRKDIRKDILNYHTFVWEKFVLECKLYSYLLGKSKGTMWYYLRI